MSSGHRIIKNETNISVLPDEGNVTVRLRLLNFSINDGDAAVMLDARIANGGDGDTVEAIAYLTPQEVITLAKHLAKLAVAALIKDA